MIKSKDSLTTTSLNLVRKRINDHSISLHDQLDQVDTLAEERLQLAEFLRSLLERILPKLPKMARPKDSSDHLARLQKVHERLSGRK